MDCTNYFSDRIFFFLYRTEPISLCVFLSRYNSFTNNGIFSLPFLKVRYDDDGMYQGLYWYLVFWWLGFLSKVLTGFQTFSLLNFGILWQKYKNIVSDKRCIKLTRPWPNKRFKINLLTPRPPSNARTLQIHTYTTPYGVCGISAASNAETFLSVAHWAPQEASG